MPDSAYWDSCTFISLLQRTAGRVGALEYMWQRGVNGDLEIVTSTFTLVEVHKLPESGLLPKEEEEKIIALFENPWIIIRQLDRPTAIRARELTLSHGLTNADAVHIATALVGKVPVFYTYDDAKGKRRGLLRHNLAFGDPPLKIEVPPDPPPPPPPPQELPLYLLGDDQAGPPPGSNESVGQIREESRTTQESAPIPEPLALPAPPAPVEKPPDPPKADEPSA